MSSLRLGPALFTAPLVNTNVGLQAGSFDVTDWDSILLTFARPVVAAAAFLLVPSFTVSGLLTLNGPLLDIGAGSFSVQTLAPTSYRIAFPTLGPRFSLGMFPVLGGGTFGPFAMYPANGLTRYPGAYDPAWAGTTVLITSQSVPAGQSVSTDFVSGGGLARVSGATFGTTGQRLSLKHHSSLAAQDTTYWQHDIAADEPNSNVFDLWVPAGWNTFTLTNTSAGAVTSFAQVFGQ